MTDNASDGVSAPAAQPAALKSTDTLKTESTPAPKVEAAKPAKPDAPAKSEQQTQAPPDSGEEAPPEGDHAPAAASPERKEQRLPRWMKERLERERQVTAARTREQVLREMQANPPPAQTQRQAEPPGQAEKTLEDFDFDPVAYQKYLARQAVEDYKREQLTQAEQQKHAAAADEFKAKIDAFEARVGAGAWEDIESSPLNADPKFKPLVDLFLGDEHDLEIAHHLTQHPAEADRLLALSPLQRVREVAKLADKFSDEPPAQAAVLPPKKTTNAPPPPKTVSGAGKPAVDVRSPDISTADRIRAWKAGKG